MPRLTPFQIKETQRRCASDGMCSGCLLYSSSACRDTLCAESLRYIEELEAHNDALKAENDKLKSTQHIATAIEHTKSKMERYTSPVQLTLADMNTYSDIYSEEMHAAGLRISARLHELYDKRTEES